MKENKKSLNEYNLRFRIQEQPKFTNYSKDHAHLFLHACLWDEKAAKKAITKYGKIRADAPDLFNDRDIMLPAIQFVFENA